MATLRQLTANRQNAQKSTGPKTEEGKARSRGNALSHGLAGAGVVLPDEEADAVLRRLEEWRDGFDPASPEEEWLFREVVVNSVRIDHCHRHETTLRAYQARRASLCWDDDRRLDAEETAASLARSPARVRLRLGRTTQGCDWLLERWLALGAVLDRGGDWTEAQAGLALDLLGTPPELRDLPPAGDLPALVAREVAALDALKADALDELDDVERSAAAVGLEVEPCRALTRLRRYEASCLRRFQWARLRLLAGQAPAPAPSRAPARESDFGDPPRPPEVEPPPARREPTEADYRAYDRAIYSHYLAGRASESAQAAAEAEAEAEPEPQAEPEPEPEVTSDDFFDAPTPRLSDALASPPAPKNRRARRAAARRSARRR